LWYCTCEVRTSRGCRLRLDVDNRHDSPLPFYADLYNCSMEGLSAREVHDCCTRNHVSAVPAGLGGEAAICNISIVFVQCAANAPPLQLVSFPSLVIQPKKPSPILQLQTWIPKAEPIWRVTCKSYSRSNPSSPKYILHNRHTLHIHCSSSSHSSHPYSHLAIHSYFFRSSAAHTPAYPLRPARPQPRVRRS
jgi:hypothetical protein